MKNDPNGITTNAIHVGFDVMAKATTRRAAGKPSTAQLVIMSEDGQDEGAYFPAQCIKINSLNGIMELRNFCNEILSEVELPKEDSTKP